MVWLRATTKALLHSSPSSSLPGSVPCSVSAAFILDELAAHQNWLLKPSCARATTTRWGFRTASHARGGWWVCVWWWWGVQRGMGCVRSRGRTSSPARPTPAACSSPTASARPPPQPRPALPSPAPGSAGAWGVSGLRSWPEPRPSERAQPAAAATQRQRGESEPGDACRRGRAHLLLLPQLLRAPSVKATVLHEELLGEPAPVINLRRRKPLRRCR